MMDELMDAEEWPEEEWIEDDSFMELEKARGERVIKSSKKKLKGSKKQQPLEQLIIIFEDTDNLEIEESYEIKINGSNIITGQYIDKNTKFKEVDVKKLKGKRFLEYVAGENATGSELILTLAFEKGFSIEISNYIMVEECK